MARFVFMTFLVLNLITLPSYCAFDEPSPFPDLPLFNPFLPFGGFDDANDQQQPQQPFVEPQQPVDQPPQLDDPSQPKKHTKNPQQAKLEEGFYSNSCPNAEQIVADQVAQIVKTNPGAIAALIRLQFHDCFVGVRHIIYIYNKLQLI